MEVGLLHNAAINNWILQHFYFYQLPLISFTDVTVGSISPEGLRVFFQR